MRARRERRGCEKTWAATQASHACTGKAASQAAGGCSGCEPAPPARQERLEKSRGCLKECWVHQEMAREAKMAARSEAAMMRLRGRGGAQEGSCDRGASRKGPTMGAPV